MSIGGSAYGPPVLVKHGDGRLEVFVVGLDGHMFRKPQAGPNQPFVANWIACPTNLQIFLYGEDVLFDPLTTRIATATHQNGNLYVFARTARGRLVYMHTTTPGGPFTGWKSIAALQDGHPALGNPTVAPPFLDRPMMLCVRAKTGNVLSKTLNGQVDDWGDPARWTDHGGLGSGDPVAGRCGLEAAGMVHTSIYVRGLDNGLYWMGDSDHRQYHDQWRRVFDDSMVGAKLSGDPVITLAGMGVVWRGMDGNLWRMRHEPFGTFRDVEPLGWPNPSWPSASDPAYVASMTSPRWAMFWQSPAGVLRMTSDRDGGPRDVLRTPLGVKVISKPSANMSADGRLEAVFLGSDSAVYHVWETAPGSGEFNEGA